VRSEKLGRPHHECDSCTRVVSSACVRMCCAAKRFFNRAKPADAPSKFQSIYRVIDALIVLDNMQKLPYRRYLKPSEVS